MCKYDGEAVSSVDEAPRSAFFGVKEEPLDKQQDSWIFHLLLGDRQLPLKNTLPEETYTCAV